MTTKQFYARCIITVFVLCVEAVAFLIGFTAIGMRGGIFAAALIPGLAVICALMVWAEDNLRRAGDNKHEEKQKQEEVQVTNGGGR